MPRIFLMYLSLVSLQTQEGPVFHNKYSTCYAKLRLQPSTYFTLFYFILVVVCKEFKCFFPLLDVYVTDKLSMKWLFFLCLNSLISSHTPFLSFCSSSYFLPCPLTMTLSFSRRLSQSLSFIVCLPLTISQCSITPRAWSCFVFSLPPCLTHPPDWQ